MAQESFHRDFALKMGNKFLELYWLPLWTTLRENPSLLRTVPAFLANPDKIVFYLGKHHIGVEYFGPMIGAELQDHQDFPLTFSVFDYRKEEYLLDNILGITYDDSSFSDFRLPLSHVVHELYMPTNRAHDALQQNGWNFGAQSMILTFNSPGPDIVSGEITRIVDSYFYDAVDSRLKVRHVKWLDLFPCANTFDVDDDHDQVAFKIFPDPRAQAVLDASSTFRNPPDFQLDKLRQLNRFIELVCGVETTEPDITRFLNQEENHFILKLGFFCTELYAEMECAWSESERAAIIPDFLIRKPNGFSDIVEFKLPNIGNSIIVGRDNRETFSAQINTYISQTRVYEEYFDDPRNRDFVQTQYGITILHSKRLLVVGRRTDFPTTIWKSIENDFRNLTLITYDDLFDGVRGQLYS